MASKRKDSGANAIVLNHISQGTVLAGHIETSGDLSIEGKIVGTINCKAKLVIGVNGYVEGNVYGNNIIIRGKVKGTVITRELLQMFETGRIIGDVYTEKLAVQPGASFSGNCRMGRHAKEMISTNPEKIESVVERESSKLRREAVPLSPLPEEGKSKPVKPAPEPRKPREKPQA